MEDGVAALPLESQPGGQGGDGDEKKPAEGIGEEDKGRPFPSSPKGKKPDEEDEPEMGEGVEEEVG